MTLAIYTKIDYNSRIFYYDYLHRLFLMKKLALFSLLLMIFGSMFTGVASWYDLKNTKQWKVYTSKSVDTSIPGWFAPKDTKDLNYWLNVLPHKQDRNHDQYLVIPAMGLVSPINQLDKSNPDYTKAIKGGNFDYNKYLESGPTIYPGTASIWQTGNTFIFAHSNFWYAKPGRYKTIFRLTYNIEKWDLLYFYKKINWKRYLYEYTVNKSFLVKETDIYVMNQVKNKSMVTLSACYPIGTAKQRWINQADLKTSWLLDQKYIPTTNTATGITLVDNAPPKIIRKYVKKIKEEIITNKLP